MENFRVAVIGIGGIGSWLLEPVYKYLKYSYKGDFELTLFDGDTYEEKNLNRQKVIQTDENKATVWMNHLKGPRGENVFSVEQYLSETNIEDLKRMNVIFLAVDNHATRKLVDDWFTVNGKGKILISGGNDYSDGNVMVRYWDKNLKQISPPFSQRHREIATPPDKNPADMSCEELAAESDPQLIFTNVMMASMMMNAFHKLMIDGEIDYEEVYGDILQNKARPVQWFKRPDIVPKALLIAN